MAGLRRILVLVGAVSAVGAVTLAGRSWIQRHQDPASDKRSGLAAFRSAGVDASNAHADSTAFFPVTIRRPSGSLAIETGEAAGASAVSCGVCHSLREPNLKNRTTADLTEFHLGMTFAHGSVTCLSCHNPDDYNTLRLADQQPLLLEDVMTLCAQCHGPQARDYQHGAHGGMTGYWDLTRGPRTRNGCTDCHDPHAPAFPLMQPTFKPKDRFLTPTHDHQGAAHE